MSNHDVTGTDARLNTLLERLRNASLTRGARIIAFTAPHADCGTSLLAGLFAKRLTEAGLSVLLLDASLGADMRTPTAGWEPGDGTAKTAIAKLQGEADRLWIAVNPADAGRFNDPQRLASMFKTDLATYDAVIVDCAPARIGSGAAIEAMTIAALADATFLIGKANRTLGHERDAALLLLRECKAELRGVIINDAIAPSLGAEIARETRRFERFLPGLARRIAVWALGIRLFDLPA